MNESRPLVNRVAGMIRDRARGEVSASVDAQSRARFVGLLSPRKASPRVPWARIAWAAAAAFAVVSIALSSRKVTYAVEPTASNAEDAAGSRLRFSDGSHLHLWPGGHGHVSLTRWRGAGYELEDGTLDVDVVHRFFTSWSVQAGPFTVHVTGTQFVVSWSPSDRKLVVALREGSVDVEGELLDSGRKIAAGERLVVDLAARTALVDHEPSDQAAAQPLPTASDTSALPTDSPQVENPGEVAPHSVEPRFTDSGHSPGSLRMTWSERVAAGDFRGVIDEARAQGIETALDRSTSADLLGLADAARYLGDRALSERALNAERKRFPGTERSAMAAFLMGRLSEDGRDTGTALSWYDRYLAEQPQGTFAQEALGRKLLLVQRANRSDALAIAHDYLRRFPHGPNANVAQQLVDGR